MSDRTRKEHKRYIKYRRSVRNKKDCVFCEIQPGNDQFVEENNSFKVIINLFPYTHWDNQNIENHLLVVPKKHIDTLSGLTPDEAQDYVQLISKYEKKGYNVWARAAQSVRKSVVHQHTHLLKPGRKLIKFMFYIRNPYIRFTN